MRLPAQTPPSPPPRPAHVARLQDLLGAPTPVQLMRILRSQPSVLMCNTDSLADKLAMLQELLGVSRQRQRMGARAHA